MFFATRRLARSAERAPALTDAQLARTIKAMARNYTVLDPYRAAVLTEAAERLMERKQRQTTVLSSPQDTGDELRPVAA